MKHILTATLAVAIALLGSCTKSDELGQSDNGSNFPTDGVMRFTSSVANPQSRAGVDDTSITDQTIYLFVTPEGAPTGSEYIYKGASLQYSNGVWDTYAYSYPDNLAPVTLLWKDKTTKVDVIAFTSVTPHSFGYDFAPNEFAIIESDQTTATNIVDNDKVYFHATIDPAKDLDANGKMTLNMRHVYSKVNVSISLGTEFSKEGAVGRGDTNPVSGVKIGDTYVMDGFNLQTGEFSQEYELSTKEAISPLFNNFTAATSIDERAVAKYECILIPQTVATGAFYVSFSVDTVDYSWTSTSEIKLESGKEYNLKLTVGQDAVKVAGFTSAPWAESTGSDLTTD